jgi:hypothetical protein
MQKLIFGIALFFCFSAFMAHAQTAPPEVISAAEAGLQPFLSRISPEVRESYGFAKSDAFGQVHLGDSFNLYTITPDALLNYSAGSQVSSLLSKTNMWYFLVMVENKVRCILIVDQIDGKWQAVSLGYADLAKALSKVMQRWPKSKGFNPWLIAVFQANEYLVMVPEESSDTLLSLLPAREELLMDNVKNVIERLKPTVREAIKKR